MWLVRWRNQSVFNSTHSCVTKRVTIHRSICKRSLQCCFSPKFWHKMSSKIRAVGTYPIVKEAEFLGILIILLEMKWQLLVCSCHLLFVLSRVRGSTTYELQNQASIWSTVFPYLSLFLPLGSSTLHIHPRSGCYCLFSGSKKKSTPNSTFLVASKLTQTPLEGKVVLCESKALSQYINNNSFAFNEYSMR